MAGTVRRCRRCHQPLRVTARADAQHCSSRCRAAERRWQAHYAEAVEFGLAIVEGRKPAVARRCPQCGRWFIPGHGRRRDAIYDRDACRVAAWRERVRKAVSDASSDTAPGTGCMPLTCEDDAIKVGAAETMARRSWAVGNGGL
jgi:hypothetical protein